MCSFDKFRSRILEHEIYDVKCETDKYDSILSITFILNDGTIFLLNPEAMRNLDGYLLPPEIMLYEQVEP